MKGAFRMNTMPKKAWILGRTEGAKFIAHAASAGPAGTHFIPLFQFKRDAVEYRNLRLEMPALKIRRVEVSL
jgi:hypothetical protein